MSFQIDEVPLTRLAELGGISIAFVVDRLLEVRVVDGGMGGIALTERTVETPYLKDYDAIAGEGPARWADRFDISRWGLLAATDGGQWIGGAVLAFDTPGVNMLDGRRDLAVLWDLRVATAARRRGAGSALFGAAVRWAAARACTQLKIETQNINVAACRFYAAQGCELGAVHRFAYPDLPGETQLLWYRSTDTTRVR
jgi:GNAT superfamily N-acetyltransferase